jgi:hypothetical protein
MRLLRAAVMALTLVLVLPTAVLAELNFESLSNLPPAEQYRQLSLMLLVSGGAQPELVNALLGPGETTAVATPEFDPDAYRTPLTRIVDRDSMLLGSAHMFRFTRDHYSDIRARLDVIESNEPELVGSFNLNLATEDAVLIRQAIADSIEYSDLGSDAAVMAMVEQYRLGTVRLRNVLEYEQFSIELDRLTQEAIQSVGGKLDAYQRMFDDEMGTSTFDRHIDAAEYIYNKEEFNQKAGDMTEEIIENMVLLESQPHQTN